MVQVRSNDLHQLQAIAEAAARVAEELGHTGGAKNIRNVIERVDADLGQERTTWDNYGVVNEWSGEIKGAAARRVIHTP